MRRGWLLASRTHAAATAAGAGGAASARASLSRLLPPLALAARPGGGHPPTMVATRGASAKAGGGVAGADLNVDVTRSNFAQVRRGPATHVLLFTADETASLRFCWSVACCCTM